MTREALVAELSALVAARNTRNEIPCGKLLEVPEAASVLLPLGTQIVIVTTELRTSSGDVDLLIVADETLAGGHVCRRSYVWEIKAPQLSLFRVETMGRARPTDDLYSAENQLLHYHAYVAGSEQDRRQFRILSPSDVRMRRIIIGTSDSFVMPRSDMPEVDARRLAERARDIRDTAFWGPKNIRLFTWTMVVDQLRRVTASHTVFQAAGTAAIALQGGPVIGGSTGGL